MNKFKIFGLVLLTSVSVSQAQDINQAKKAIDAEKYEEAKSILKSILQAKPSNGMASFILGNVYLTQSIKDSARISYEKGLTASESARFNHIGLGQIDLDNNDIPSATAKFALATKDMRKKDFEEYVYIARAYMNTSKPDYKSAIAVLNRALVNNPQDAQVLLALGDAYYGESNQNEAYKAYRDAFSADNTLLRAKMQLGVLLKGAKSYDEASKAYNEVIAINPNYGPVYRELAETYYKIARNKPSKAAENYKIAIDYYQKYMDLTDYSIHSRMRRADFMILVKDYRTLEEEANKMIQLDKVNPRIYRYLGYAAYENGNTDKAIQSLETFTSNTSNKIIAKDFQVLGLAKIKKGTSADGLSIDPVAFDAGLTAIKKSIEMEPLAAEDLNEVGKKFFSQKLFKEAAAIFELGTTNQESKNYLDDNLYFGLSLYYANSKKDVKPDAVALQKADAAFDKVLVASPGYYEAFLFKARTNSLIDNDANTIKYYEAYVAAVTAKGADEVAKPAVVKKIAESYNTIGATYANTDKVKAVEYFNKTLAIDPTNAYALSSIKQLK
ncbi:MULTISPECIES: tetratricopeptide repeat protein [unclassified Flavobacterium]|uniref:tetratricopeptide repeat protein n=2 Tax=Flavobacterium TaxID=237 RepID=UPI0022248DFE|nr:tetratricopeptide repeat protein [Flavobacterium sp. N2013]